MEKPPSVAGSLVFLCNIYVNFGLAQKLKGVMVLCRSNLRILGRRDHFAYDSLRNLPPCACFGWLRLINDNEHIMLYNRVEENYFVWTNCISDIQFDAGAQKRTHTTKTEKGKPEKKARQKRERIRENNVKWQLSQKAGISDSRSPVAAVALVSLLPHRSLFRSQAKTCACRWFRKSDPIPNPNPNQASKPKPRPKSEPQTKPKTRAPGGSPSRAKKAQPGHRLGNHVNRALYNLRNYVSRPTESCYGCSFCVWIMAS